ncbi:glycine-rich domain-containing protein [Neokomagataea anthophila]|uniref:Glycine-rich domain-containing protein n=1 Tax=Neokomagataea anthophila TaxID=2826925 RepID=A0ABS5E6F4_9PROT|nr:hypothetical protein [Neokomagataea anthophila]MBR0559488.1 hypothetical protein [Neokomagataea anthophila]
MDYTTSPGNIVINGRRQFVARDRQNGVSGTTISDVDMNALFNSLIYAQQAAGLTANASDETQIWQAMQRSASIAANAVAETDANALQALNNQFQQAISALKIGRLLRIIDIQSAQSYTPGTDARSCIVEVIGAGGAGGGAPGNQSGSGTASVGGAGGCGGYACLHFDLSLITLSNVTVQTGLAGAGLPGQNGGNGTDSSFGSFVTCKGGYGGTVNGPVAAGKPVWTSQGFGGDVFPINPIPQGLQFTAALKGQNGDTGFLIPNADGKSPSAPMCPIGPASQMGSGGQNVNTSNDNSTNDPATGFGAGGGGCGSVGTGTITGGNGAPGRVLVWEYA